MKLIDVNSSTYVDSGVQNNDEDPKFKVRDHIRLSKYEKVFAKGYTSNWYEEVFVIKKVKNTLSWTCVIEDLNGGEIAKMFYEKELQKTN